VLDTSAMIAYLRGELGADEVESRLEDDSEPCLAHAVNICEVYYKAMERSGEEAAESAISDLRGQGLEVSEHLNEHFWRDVARHKATMNSVPLADWFVVVLTMHLNAAGLEAEAVTADHPDFDPVAERGLCPVVFIR
jgi:predicted nucleic acid-binding protein